MLMKVRTNYPYEIFEAVYEFSFKSNFKTTGLNWNSW